MRKSVLLASLAVVSFSVLGIENIPNFGNYPSHSPERNRVNVDVETTPKLNPSKKQDISTIFGDTVQKFLNGELYLFQFANTY